MYWSKEHKKIFRAIIESLLASNIEYFILRNYEGLPYRNIAKDIDIVVNPHKVVVVKGVILSTCKSSGVNYLTIREYSDSTSYFLSFDAGVMQLDILFGLKRRGMEVLDFFKIHARHNYYGDLVIPNGPDLIETLIVTKCFAYTFPDLKKRYIRLIQTSCQDNCDIKELAKYYLGETLVDSIILGTELKRDELKAVGRHVTSRVWRQMSVMVRFKNVFKLSVWYMEEAIRRVNPFKKRKPFIVFLAPDGAGKSTLISGLMSRISEFYNTNETEIVDYNHFRPHLMPNLGALRNRLIGVPVDEGFSNPHRGKPSNTYKSFFRLSYYLIDYIIGVPFIIGRNKRRHKYTVFDRYGYDFIVDPSRSSLTMSSFARWLAIALLPKPDLVVFLDTDPEIVRERKQELSFTEIGRQNNEYLKLLEKISPEVLILDGNYDVEIVLNQLWLHFLDNYMIKCNE